MITISINAHVHNVTIIAHMVNTPTSVRWALEQGANGIELDLKFSGTHPSRFHHGIFCDCSCLPRLSLSKENICRALDEGCSGSFSATAMTTFLGSKEIVSSHLALIYIDAKIDDSVGDYKEAGANVVRLLNKNVMAQGYRGHIIVGIPNFKFFGFLEGALQEANKSAYANRYFYAIDHIKAKSEEVWDYMSQLNTRNIVYSMGIASCFFIDNSFYNEISYGLDSKAFRAVGVWTVDRPISMDTYLKLGVDYFITNRPKLGVEMVISFPHYRLAQPGYALTSL